LCGLLVRCWLTNKSCLSTKPRGSGLILGAGGGNSRVVAGVVLQWPMTYESFLAHQVCSYDQYHCGTSSSIRHLFPLWRCPPADWRTTHPLHPERPPLSWKGDASRIRPSVCTYCQTIALAAHSLINVSVRFHQACLDQTHVSCGLLPPCEPIKARHQKSHDDDAIAGGHAQLIWALGVVLQRGHTASSGCTQEDNRWE